jgi:predicted nucleotidyltransferase
MRPHPLDEKLANRLSAAGAFYATVFGSAERGTERFDSDIDVAVSFGKTMSSKRKMTVVALIAGISGRSVDLIDLEKAEGLILAQALGGREILCDSVATRTRMAMRLIRFEDDRMSVARAMRSVRTGLFT